MKVFLAIILVLALLAIAPWFLMLGWNYVMPYLFNLKEINFWQSFALLIVSGILMPHSYKSTTKE